MRLLPVVSLGALLADTVVAQGTFEPKDFNVTEALLENGVDSSILIGLEESLDGTLRKRANPCSLACSTLKAVFGGSKLYTSDALAYWSLIADGLTPACTFKPTSAIDVSTFVLLSRLTQCPFAVKGGGHTGFAGASSIDGGIALSLERFKNVDIQPGSDNIVAVGPGNRWFDVYTALEDKNLAVIGGRAAGVGVPGLTLGGGISHHINARGFACDNVAAYEVVTSSGIIVKATPKTHPDLYWALRGAGVGGNFGVVTNFYLEAFPQGPMWGGSRGIPETQIPAGQKAFFNMASNAAQDTKAAHYFAMSSVQLGGGQVMKRISFDLQYSEPINTASPPKILKEYLAIQFEEDKLKKQSLADTTIYLNQSQPDGSRQLFWSIPAMKLDLGMMKYMGDLFFKPGSTPDAGGLTPVVSLTYQAISVPALRRMERNGGNALGLKAANGPLFHCALFFRYSGGVAEDNKVYKAAKAFEDAVVAEAKRRGLSTSYIYANYAGPYHKVVEGYGVANQQKLKAIAKKYDPTGVFRRLQPGGHKLEGSPSYSSPA